MMKKISIQFLSGFTAMLMTIALLTACSSDDDDTIEDNDNNTGMKHPLEDQAGEGSYEMSGNESGSRDIFSVIGVSLLNEDTDEYSLHIGIMDLDFDKLAEAMSGFDPDSFDPEDPDSYEAFSDPEAMGFDHTLHITTEMIGHPADVLTTGTYDIVSENKFDDYDQTVFHAIYSDLTVPIVYADSVSGSLTVNHVSKERFAGTFEFTAYSSTDTGEDDPKVIHIKNGTFDGQMVEEGDEQGYYSGGW